MRDFSDLRTCELLALGRRALELAGQHFDRIARAVYRDDEPLRALLQKMSLDSSIRAAEVEQRENLYPEESTLSAFPEEALGLIRGYLTSLTRSFGEGPLNRDAALFFAESLEEELSRLCLVLAQHAREWLVADLFSDLARLEQRHVRYLRDVVFQG